MTKVIAVDCGEDKVEKEFEIGQWFYSPRDECFYILCFEDGYILMNHAGGCWNFTQETPREAMQGFIKSGGYPVSEVTISFKK